jgi:hypothetical protein
MRQASLRAPGGEDFSAELASQPTLGGLWPRRGSDLSTTARYTQVATTLIADHGISSIAHGKRLPPQPAGGARLNRKLS